MRKSNLKPRTLTEFIVGVVLLFALVFAVRAYQQHVIATSIGQQMERISESSQRNLQQIREQQAAREAQAQSERREKEEAAIAARQLAPNQRCIGKQLFERVDNGWVQVTDGSASTKCPR